MSKRRQRWPMWKIAVFGAICVVAAVGLFSISAYLDSVEELSTPDPKSAGVLSLPGFALILGMAASMLALIFLTWLGLRVREARTPPWERKAKSRRR